MPQRSPIPRLLPPQLIYGGRTPLQLGVPGRAKSSVIGPVFARHVSDVSPVAVALIDVALGAATYFLPVGGIPAWSLSLGGSFQ